MSDQVSRTLARLAFDLQKTAERRDDSEIKADDLRWRELARGEAETQCSNPDCDCGRNS